MLTTDLLSRGVDLEGVKLVVSFDLPRLIETYIHRIGRTARFGKLGISIAFITSTEERKKLLENSKYTSKIKELPKNLKGIRNLLKEIKTD